VDKLPEKPEYAPRIAEEIDKLYAQLKIIDVERTAEAVFEARRSVFESRAKELYTVDKAKYTVPEQISASHMLFETKSRPKEAAEKLARDAQAKLAAGADFNKLALEISEDGSAKRNSGRLGWFGFQEMDPAFAKAAFALKQTGEISPPVLSSFGWHLIRLDDRRPARPMTFEEARVPIMAELRTKHVNDRREAFLQTVRNDPTIRANRVAIDALVTRVDTDEVRRQIHQVAPGAMAPPSK
jgi:parvulin-like peptidyl-prolyl isomerase